MSKLNIFFIILMLILTTVATVPMIGLPAVTYGVGNYTIQLTPAIVLISMSTIYLIITIIATMIAYSISSHMERAVSKLAEKLANCQYEKSKLTDKNSDLEKQIENLKDLYEKQLKIIEKVTMRDEKEEKTDKEEEMGSEAGSESQEV